MALFETWMGALKDPKGTFSAEKGKASIGAGIKNLAIAGVIAGILGAILILAVGTPATEVLGTFSPGLAAGMTIVSAIMAIIVTPIGAIIGWFIVGGIYFIFAKIFGGKGSYTTQIYLMSLYMAPIMVIQGIFGLVYIPIYGAMTIGAILSAIVGIYALYPLTMALREAHEYTLGKAVATWLVPFAIIMAIMVVALASMAMSAVGFFGI